MNFVNLIGATLDEKYRIERELGRGGMGTVYLATHIGTERPVAVKIIAPQFMERSEFVERFRREARAAGRLRHPNVVNVTDFGFASTKDGTVAYLVMEYLDGCTLGEILEEEQKLPLAWTLDIIEQVCSAVHEAHRQGIIHRDLKPDNIWLEPNQRGSYTVKVLDFGIAKLEEEVAESEENKLPDTNDTQNRQFFAAPQMSSGRATVVDAAGSDTHSDLRNSTRLGEARTLAQIAESGTLLSEAGTLVQSSETNDKNAAFLNNETLISDQKEAGTKIISEQIHTSNSSKNSTSARALIGQQLVTKELTRVGAVLGTPLYMSPEQCRGEKLTAQSDIYSLGVITYQMLGGKTPFSGNYKEVMDAHTETPPPPLEAKKIRKKVKRVINSALEKTIEKRPQTAAAFASELRAQSEGIGTLLMRSLEIYSRHLPKFLGLTILLYSPFVIVTLLRTIFDVLYVSGAITGIMSAAARAAFTLTTTFVAIFCGYLVFGTTTWLVTQILSVPLRPVRIRPALKATRIKWKSLIGTGLISTALTFVGYIFCFVPGLILSVIWALVAPVVMMENRRGRAALKRSKALVMRSLRTTTAAVFIMFLVPFTIASITGFFASTTVKSFARDAETAGLIDKDESSQEPQKSENSQVPQNAEKPDINISFGSDENIKISENMSNGSPKSMNSRIREVAREGLTNILMLPFQIFIASIWSIIVALLYLKTRQVGGESMNDLMAQFEEADQPRTNWQRRVHERLEQSGRTTGKSQHNTEKRDSDNLKKLNSSV